MFKLAAHRPFFQDQCRRCNGRERTEFHPRVFRRRSPPPPPGPRGQHTLFYHPDAVCIQATSPVIKWETVASSRCSEWQRENVLPSERCNSLHFCFRFQSRFPSQEKDPMMKSSFDRRFERERADNPLRRKRRRSLIENSLKS